VLSILRSIWVTLTHLGRRRITVEYPGQVPYLAPRFRGRIVLTRDPDGEERCVACYLCSAACPVGCIFLEAARDERDRRYPASFRINFSRCIFCGLCEEACPTYAIQLTPDFETADYRRADLLYEKEDLLVDGPGKVHEYNYYRHAGVAAGVKGRGTGEDELPPADVRELLP